MNSPTDKRCRLCGGSGWLHGAQEWTARRMSKGTPYKSVRCDCRAPLADTLNNASQNEEVSAQAKTIPSSTAPIDFEALWKGSRLSNSDAEIYKADIEDLVRVATERTGQV